MRSSIGGNESENPPAARVATIFMGLLVRASDSRPREFASLPAQGPNKSWLEANGGARGARGARDEAGTSVKN